jgi:sugar phosphate isomerase/epimerase
MKRRHFLQGTLASAISIPAFALEAGNPYRKNIGIQLYTLRNQIKEDVSGTMAAVAEAGYRQVECYGFPNAGEVTAAAKDNGMAVNSSHFVWESVTEPDKEGVPEFISILEEANKVGISHLVIPYLYGRNRENLDDYLVLAERMNKAAMEAKSAGIQLAYHNHAFEFEPMAEGKSGFDIFVEEFVPEMKFEVDVFWVVVGGKDPVALIRSLKGRVSQLHLKDLEKGTKLPNFGNLPNEAFRELGNGMIPMEPIIQAASEVGVDHCHVEQDQSPDPIASIGTSMKYLKSL